MTRRAWVRLDTALIAGVLEVPRLVHPRRLVAADDLTLRPGGRAGVLTRTLDATLAYYEREAATWERQAMIKARPVAGDRTLGNRFLKEVEPFVYRRYLDYTTVEELRHMKLRIENELEYPGQIKVTVIRETRAVEFAR